MTEHYYRIIPANDDENQPFFLKMATPDPVNLITDSTAKGGITPINRLSHVFTASCFPQLNISFKNGQDCLSEIHTQIQYEKTPTEIFSEDADMGQISTTFKAGTDLYVSNPDTYLKIKTILKTDYTLT